MQASIMQETISIAVGVPWAGKLRTEANSSTANLFLWFLYVCVHIVFSSWNVSTNGYICNVQAWRGSSVICLSPVCLWTWLEHVPCC